MKKRNKNNYKNNKQKVVDVAATPVVEEKKPTIQKGNYIIEVLSEGKVIKKVAVANAEINITKLVDGGLTVDLG
ncbi:hypothetical protein K5V21_03570 [Clostridium sardiniense]|uniref:Uncharacterized protein n=1 Tax=Clostridium sardiniense TaxID=29369 RepID=A0ABS7KUN3_CLOSR|nr:hypothetical protein [Clostridium sardiniense]MBY0754530.1 hypothetical protein [Clostridium sardiniense]MDQ0460874.1 hypothetical protein [Clostridium sardiniense]